MTNSYLDGERDKMRIAGYITAHEAAEAAQIHVSGVYKTIEKKRVRTKIGNNKRSKYIHREDWTKVINERIARLRKALGSL